MTRCIFISDTHGCHQEVIDGKTVDLQITDGDVLVHCGDFSARGTVLNIVSFNEWMGKQSHRRKICGPGNHDCAVQINPSLSKGLLTNAELMIHEPFDINGIPCFFTPWQPFYKNWSYNEKVDLTRKRLFDMIPDNVEILFSHCPPYGYLDKGFQAPHVGDKMLLERIRELKKLRYVVFGHIHNGRGSVQNNGITFINCSLLNDRYELKNKPVVIEL